MANNTLTVAQPSSRNNGILLVLGILIVLGLYVNVTKVLLGSRYFILLADGLLLTLSLYAITHRMLSLKPIFAFELVAFAFIGIGLVQIFNPNIPEFMTGIEGYRRTMYQMLAIFVGAAAVNTREDAMRIVRWIGIAAVPILLYGIKQFFFKSAFDHAIIASNTAAAETWTLFGQIRSFGIFNGPFHLGLFGGIVFWIAIALFNECRNRWWLVVALLSVLASVASLTRSTVLAILISIPLISMYVFPRYRLRVMLATGAAIGAVLLTAATLRDSYPAIDLFVESISSVENITDDSRLTHRVVGYEEGLHYLAQNPFGLGMGSAADAMDEHFTPHGKTHITSHNLFLCVALETGWIGLLLFFTLIVFILMAVRQFKRQDDKPLAILLLGSFMVLFISGITGSTLGAYPINLIYWAISGGLVCFASRMQLQQAES